MKSKTINKSIYSCLAESLELNGDIYIQLLESAMEKLSKETVHQTRVTIRKIEACLELVDCLGIGHKKLTKDLEYFRKIFGPLRNMHVELESIKEFEAQVKSDSFKKFLKKREEKSKKKLLKELRNVSLNKQNKELQKLVIKLLQNDIPMLNEKAVVEMKTQNHKLFNELKKTKRGFLPNIPKTIHPIRITAKRIRYQGEILKPVMSFDNVNLSQLKYLQDTFGKIQNNNVLLKTIDKYLKRGSSKGSRAVIKLQSQIIKEQHDLMTKVARMKVMMSN